MNADYDTTRAEFEVHFAQSYADIKTKRERVTEAHKELLLLTTVQEVEAISKSRTTAMHAPISTIAGGPARREFILIAIVTFLLLGGSSSRVLKYIGDTQDNVKVVMPKGNQQKAALSTLKAMKKRAKAKNEAVRRTAKDIEKAFADRGQIWTTLTRSGPHIVWQSISTTARCST